MAKFLFYDTDIVKLLLKDEELAGGAAVQSYVWVKGLIALGHKVCITTYGDQDNSLRPEIKDIELIPIYDRERGLKKIRMIYYRLPRVFFVLKKIRPDYVYKSIPSWESFFIGIFCRMLKIKLITRVANDNILDIGFINYYSRFDYALLRKGVKLSDYVLCQNDYQYDQLKQGFAKVRTLKIHNPFIFEERTLMEVSDKRYIAWVAKIRYVKNLKLLYEIATLMDEEQFEIAGTYTRKDSETDEYIRKLKNLKNVTFRGQIDRKEILSFLAGAKYILNTSRFEGFSNTFLEAMSVGTPILSTQNANPDQIISRNRVGIIYSDGEDLKDQLNMVSNEDYEQMCYRSIEYVKDNHDHIGLTKRLLEFLENESFKKQLHK